MDGNRYSMEEEAMRSMLDSEADDAQAPAAAGSADAQGLLQDIRAKLAELEAKLAGV